MIISVIALAAMVFYAGCCCCSSTLLSKTPVKPKSEISPLEEQEIKETGKLHWRYPMWMFLSSPLLIS
jgi:hypothetical protein